MTQQSQKPKSGERLAKVIARTGLCSRREAEALIAAGRVAVNGFIVETPAINVGPDDEVLIDGEPLPEPEPVRLWRYHKPRQRLVARPGVQSEARSPSRTPPAPQNPGGREGERAGAAKPTIYEDLPEEVQHVMPVGRLDFLSEGLLLLTNDGELKRALEHPSRGWTRRYRVRAYGRVHPERLKKQLKKLEQGITIDGVHYGSIKATLDRAEGANKWLTFALKEGKNREIRRICEHLGLKVNRLLRVSYGPFQLGSLKKGEVAEVPRKQLEELLGNLLHEVEDARFANHPRGEVVRLGFDEE